MGALLDPVPELPDALVDLLQKARRAERSAVGEQRRVAFRLSRALLGGARAAGYPLRLLASCLGVSLGSMRARSAADAWITSGELAWLLDVSTDELAVWVIQRELPASVPDELGRTTYRASDIVRAVVGSPAPQRSTQPH